MPRADLDGRPCWTPEQLRLHKRSSPIRWRSSKRSPRRRSRDEELTAYTPRCARCAASADPPRACPRRLHALVNKWRADWVRAGHISTSGAGPEAAPRRQSPIRLLQRAMGRGAEGRRPGTRSVFDKDGGLNLPHDPHRPRPAIAFFNEPARLERYLPPTPAARTSIALPPALAPASLPKSQARFGPLLSSCADKKRREGAPFTTLSRAAREGPVSAPFAQQWEVRAVRA